MIFCRKLQDGGPESTVTGYFLIEAKKLFSIVLLHFAPGSRDAYHTHAFNAISWVLRGELRESFSNKHDLNCYTPSLKPIITKRDDFHKVVSVGDSWVISLRGHWADYWMELDMKTLRYRTLTHGRKER